MPEVSLPYIELQIKPSRYQFWLISTAHLLAFVSPWFSRIGGWAFIISFVVLVHWVSGLRSQGRFACDRAVSGVRLINEQWAIRRRHNVWLDVEFVGESLVTPFVTIIRFRSQRRMVYAVLFFDAVDPEVFRQLRVRMLLHL